jgi:hypothetical protein
MVAAGHQQVLQAEMVPNDGASAAAAAAAQKRRAILRAIRGSVFLSVCQHASNVQSEPMLIRQLCGGNIPMASRVLGNTQALTGILALLAMGDRVIKCRPQSARAQMYIH